MAVLLVGDLSYFKEEDLLSSFPEDKLIVLSKKKSFSRKIRQIVLDESTNVELLVKSYNVDRLIYFSSALNAQDTGNDELSELGNILQNLKGNDKLQFLYVTGPDNNYGLANSRRFILESAEQLCLYYASQYHFSLKIVRSLHLYNLNNGDDSIGRLYHQASSEESIPLNLHPEQKAFYICPKDLLSLLYRVVDSWDYQFECLSMGDDFKLSYGQIVATLNLSDKVSFSQNSPLFELEVGQTNLKERYGWLPKVNVLEDLKTTPDLHSIKSERVEKNFIYRFFDSFNRQKFYVKVINLFIFFALTEFATQALRHQVYFKSVDFRLFFVTIIGFLFGINFGGAAAFLAIIGLAYQTIVKEGGNISTLFFEPFNWIPFIIYFIAGLVSGLANERNRDDVSRLKSENAGLQQQIEDNHDFITDLMTEKTSLTHQILGREDSYGKIYQFLLSLDTPHLDIFMMSLLDYLSTIFETKEIVVYSAAGSCLGELQVSLTNREADLILDDSQMATINAELDVHGIWVNQHLHESYPMLLFPLRDGEAIRYYVMIEELAADKLNLFYQNQFKVLAGLANMSFKRWSEKYSSLNMDQDYAILDQADFYNKLKELDKIQSSFYDGRVLQLHFARAESQLVGLEYLKSSLGMFDSLALLDGHLYLLTNLRDKEAMPKWEQLLARCGFAIQTSQSIEAMIEEIEFSQMIS